MRHSSLLRSLLVSVVALTLSHAVVIRQTTQCNPTDHYGKLAIWETYPTGAYFRIGYVNSVPLGSIFGEATPDNAGQFYFNGCSWLEGGSSYPIYCTNCDDGSGSYGIIQVRSSTYDTWYLYHSASNLESIVVSRQDSDYDLSYFEYDGTSINPVIFHVSPTRLQPSMSLDGSMSFIEGATIYSLVWEENIGE